MYFCEQFLLVCIQGRVQKNKNSSFRIRFMRLEARLVARFSMAKDFSNFSSALLSMIFLIQNAPKSGYFCNKKDGFYEESVSGERWVL